MILLRVLVLLPLEVLYVEDGVKVKAKSVILVEAIFWTKHVPMQDSWWNFPLPFALRW